VQLCGARTPDGLAWRQVGTDYSNECAVDLTNLANFHKEPNLEALFFDLYFVDGVNTTETSASTNSEVGGRDAMLFRQLGGRPILFPVPLIVQNMPENSDTGNGLEVLTRRSFLVDTSLGRTAGAVSPQWIQYAKSITIQIQVRLA
jgi:Meckelin (Transmembrane protein 67)